MAYEAKMKETDKDVTAFINAIEKDKKREDAKVLVELFEEISGYPPMMWGESIIGYGKYQYEYAVTDGNIITGVSAAASIEFAFAILEKLCGKEHTDKVKASIYYDARY